MNCDACKHKNVIEGAGMAIAKEEKSMKNIRFLCITVPDMV